jgi:hypothetical protein
VHKKKDVPLNYYFTHLSNKIDLELEILKSIFIEQSAIKEKIDLFSRQKNNMVKQKVLDSVYQTLLALDKKIDELDTIKLDKKAKILIDCFTEILQRFPKLK